MKTIMKMQKCYAKTFSTLKPTNSLNPLTQYPNLLRLGEKTSAVSGIYPNLLWLRLGSPRWATHLITHGTAGQGDSLGYPLWLPAPNTHTETWCTGQAAWAAPAFRTYKRCERSDFTSN